MPRDGAKAPKETFRGVSRGSHTKLKVDPAHSYHSVPRALIALEICLLSTAIADIHRSLIALASLPVPEKSSSTMISSRPHPPKLWLIRLQRLPWRRLFLQKRTHLESCNPVCLQHHLMKLKQKPKALLSCFFQLCVFDLSKCWLPFLHLPLLVSSAQTHAHVENPANRVSSVIKLMMSLQFIGTICFRLCRGLCFLLGLHPQRLHTLVMDNI